jgi:bifunctional non-homologous end joining protein LigD
MQNGKLKYIGHTGTGFSDETLKTVYAKLKPLIRTTSPFDQKVPVNSPVTWVEPVWVCNVKYTEITQDGILRHPVFMGLRIDKKAEEATTLDRPVKSKISRNRKAKV